MYIWVKEDLVSPAGRVAGRGVAGSLHTSATVSDYAVSCTWARCRQMYSLLGIRVDCLAIRVLASLARRVIASARPRMPLVGLTTSTCMDADMKKCSVVDINNHLDDQESFPLRILKAGQANCSRPTPWTILTTSRINHAANSISKTSCCALFLQSKSMVVTLIINVEVPKVSFA